MTTPIYDREQANLLRAADNADAAGVRTVNATDPVRALARELARKIIADRLSYKRALLERELEAALAQQPDIARERDLLAEGIRNAALKRGIVREDASLTGPHLLMLCEDLAQQPEAQAQEAVRMNQTAGGEAVALTAWVGTMQASNGTNYYVCVGFPGGKYITTQVYDLRGRADYDVAEWKHMLGQGPEPDILAFDTEGTTPPAAQVQQDDEYLAALDDLHKHCGYDNNHWLYQLFLKFVNTAHPAADALDLGEPDTVQVPGEGWPLRYPAADALGAVRELAAEWERIGTLDARFCARKLKEVLAQAPAVRVTHQMVLKANTQVPVIGGKPVLTYCQVRSLLESALGQGKANAD